MKMNLLAILAGLALAAPSAMATVTQTQQGELIAETNELVDGNVVKAKVFEFKANAVGSCVFGRETVTVYRNGTFTDVVKANGECAFSEFYPICRLNAKISLLDLAEERIKRWGWERDIDWSDDTGGEPVNIKKKSKLVKKNYLDVVYAYREMKCTRVADED